MYHPVKERKYTKSEVEKRIIEAYRVGIIKGLKIERTGKITNTIIAKVLGFKSESSVRWLIRRIPYYDSISIMKLKSKRRQRA